MAKKRCPKCDSKTFCVIAHVTQEWLVDENGCKCDVTEQCIDVSHQPDDDDIWVCASCGHNAPGRDFNV